MALAPASIETRTVTAHIIFVSADACDKFYDKYPNGIDLRHQSKQHAIMVEKGKNVDVISGMMQGYLECGATRVVKVSLVDDDWGIVALHKLAEGKQKVRQVEAVVDMYRNDVRGILEASLADLLTVLESYGHLPLRKYHPRGPVQRCSHSQPRL